MTNGFRVDIIYHILKKQKECKTTEDSALKDCQVRHHIKNRQMLFRLFRGAVKGRNIRSFDARMQRYFAKIKGSAYPIDWSVKK